MAATADEQLREEFNRWAEAGRGDDMEKEHLPIVLPTLELMNLEASDQVLDLGCGTGWLSRLIAGRVPQGSVVGVDLSDEMIGRAQKASAGLANMSFRVGGVDRIPAPGATFTKTISVESAYYWPDPAQGLCEISRVLRPGGSAWVLINYYGDNLYCHRWGKVFATLAIETHLLAAEEWAQLFRDAGLSGVAHRRIPDPTPAPETYTGRWFRDAEELRKFREEGALLVYGEKQ